MSIVRLLAVLLYVSWPVIPCRAASAPAAPLDVICGQVAGVPATTLPLRLERGARIAFIGNGLFERMQEHGVPVARVINGGGIPQKNETLNRVYANVLNKPILVPDDETTSLGSVIVAFMAAGAFGTRTRSRGACAGG